MDILSSLIHSGVTVGKRWQDINELCRIQTAQKNSLTFYEVHYMIAGVGAEQKADCEKIMNEVKELLK